MRRGSLRGDAWNFYLILLSFLIALAILFPAFKRAREEARREHSISRVR